MRKLLALREKGSERESARVERLRTLCAGGVVSKRELEDSEESLAAASARMKEVRLQLEGAERFLAEALLENDAPEAAGPKPVPGSATGPHIHIGRPSHRIRAQ